MKTEFKILLFYVSAFVMFACKKQGCTDEFAVNYDPSAKKELDGFCIYKNPELEEYIPSFGPNTATLVSINRGKEKHSYPSETIYSWNYTIAAKFHGNSGEYQSAGNVFIKQKIPDLTYNGFYFEEVNQLNDNSYFKNSSIGAPAQVTYFLDTIVWKGTGEDWPAFTTSSFIGFSGNSYVLSDDPSLSSSYTFQVAPMSDADSLVLEIIGQRKHIIKVISSSESTYVFSQQEIESVGRGNAFLRVVSLRYGKQTEGGKTYYMLNQKRSVKEVFID